MRWVTRLALGFWKLMQSSCKEGNLTSLLLKWKWTCHLWWWNRRGWAPFFIHFHARLKTNLIELGVKRWHYVLCSLVSVGKMMICMTLHMSCSAESWSRLAHSKQLVLYCWAAGMQSGLLLSISIAQSASEDDKWSTILTWNALLSKTILSFMTQQFFRKATKALL